MKISKESAERLGEIASEMVELLNEYKNICRQAMNSHEHNQFRYNTLAHLEPGLTSENTWVVGSHVKGLDSIAETAMDDATPENDDDDDDVCPKCSSYLNNGKCDSCDTKDVRIIP